MDNSKQEFSTLAGKMSGVVTAHGAIPEAIKNHATRHAAERMFKRQQKQTEQNLMKDIPKGGI